MRAASTVACQTQTAPFTSAWPVSTGLAGTQTKYWALPAASMARSSSISSPAPTVSFASTRTRVAGCFGAASSVRSTEPPRHRVTT